MTTSLRRGIPLDDLIALNDEIIALTRSGVPLDRGLTLIGSDLPGRLGRLARSIGRQVESGQSLTDAFASSGADLPDTYRAVVEAGLRGGRLTAALEGIADTARRVSDLRKSLLLASIYPLLVLTVAYLLLILCLTRILPVMSEAYVGLNLEQLGWLSRLARLGDHASTWAPWPLLLLYVAFGVLIYGSRRGEVLRGPTWLPSVSRLREASRFAVFGQLLSLLVKHDVPLPEALELAGGAGGGRRLRDAARELAERIRRGETTDGVDRLPRGFPPLLGWAVISRSSGDALGETLERIAELYRGRAVQMSATITSVAPIILTAGLGGLVVVGYAIIVLGPFLLLLYRVAEMRP